jgi:hypothetical protein
MKNIMAYKYAGESDREEHYDESHMHAGIESVTVFSGVPLINQRDCVLRCATDKSI